MYGMAPRVKEAGTLFDKGVTRKQIAERMGVSYGTAAHYVRRYESHLFYRTPTVIDAKAYTEHKEQEELEEMLRSESVARARTPGYVHRPFQSKEKTNDNA